MISQTELQELLDIQIKELVERKWKPLLDAPWATITIKKYHRTQLKDISNISKMKTEIRTKIGTLGPFIFLNDFFSKSQKPRPY